VSYRCTFCAFYGDTFEGSAPVVLSHAKQHPVNALNCVEKKEDQ
jgi:hypothetical protein